MSHFLLFIFRKLLNAFIYSSGNDPLLARAHGLFPKSPPTQPTHNVLISTSTTVGIILDMAIRYIISYVIMPLLILETLENRPNQANKDKKSKPRSITTRNLRQTITTLYRKGGLDFLLNGLNYACLYATLHIMLTNLLSWPLFFPHPPVAHLIASVVLAEYHFFWTAGSVLPPAEQIRYMPLDHDRDRVTTLYFPTLVYAIAETIMIYLPGSLLGEQQQQQQQYQAMTSSSVLSDITALVRHDVLVAGLMLVAQVLLLLPTYIVLVVIQGSLIPEACETLIFLPEEQQDEKKDDSDNDDMKNEGGEEEEEEYPKQQGKLIKDIFGLPGPSDPLDVIEMIGVRQLLYCLELHGKMCLCLVGVAVMVESVEYLVS
ncbi:hypothetical protein ASPBRDRAFT_26696 [Aspergillus brasiliensis CBS 101740]|uniref:Uncharacterized protein n=1 Tax=Aspergillus brasiliensis (strain CBS 101740 / IMI 381727 / IBT 21946) TaxID=767769 RepID=A0A1L9UXE3_ASPBC|nr:hypothetical protein ASPBRDRAFT_26696 [Aspergillus brasiliensis CBS 101740]